MNLKKITIFLFLVFAVIPVYKIHAAAPSTTKQPSATKSVTESNYSSIKNIGKTIEKNTPEFITKIIIRIINFLEKFRVDTFNNKFIFYPVLIMVLFLFLRTIGRLIFS